MIHIVFRFKIKKDTCRSQKEEKQFLTFKSQEFFIERLFATTSSNDLTRTFYKYFTAYNKNKLCINFLLFPSWKQ